MFRPEEYWKAQQRSSVWMWENAGEDLREFINDRYPKKGIREKRLLWKSYALQEAEAVGRDAKIAWATEHGIPVHSLQHDCVFLGKLPGRVPGTMFRPEEYWKAQQRSSVWMWENAEEDSREFINDRYPGPCECPTELTIAVLE